MSVLGRLALILLGSAVLLAARPLHAQDLDTGKSAQRLFAANCATCHRTPRGLAKQNSMFLASFLREHYTSSRESANELAAYLVANSAPPPGKQKSKAADRASRSGRNGSRRGGSHRSGSRHKVVGEAEILQGRPAATALAQPVGPAVGRRPQAAGPHQTQEDQTGAIGHGAAPGDRGAEPVVHRRQRDRNRASRLTRRPQRGRTAHEAHPTAGVRGFGARRLVR